MIKISARLIILCVKDKASIFDWSCLVTVFQFINRAEFAINPISVKEVFFVEGYYPKVDVVAT